MRAGGSPREAPAIRAGGRPAFAIPGVACPILLTRPLSALALSDLLDRKPHLLRPLAAQLLPLPAPIDPAERLGIDPASLQTVEDCRRVLGHRSGGCYARWDIAHRRRASQNG
jgi:hypothetical protein